MSMIFSFVIGLVMNFFKIIVIPILKFTGVWWTVLCTILFYKYLPDSTTTSKDMMKEIAFSCVLFIPPLIITINNILRIILKNPSFNILTSIQKKENEVKPKVTKELLNREPKGFIFGKQNLNYIAKPSDKDGHILIIGGAGSGKSSCLGIPSIISWDKRVFAIDIKGELYQKTSKNRSMVKVFNPSDPLAFGYDPFYLLKESENLAQDVKEIALALIPLPADVKEPFWIESAQNLFTGALLHYYLKGYSFIESIQSIQERPAIQLVEEIMDDDFALAKFFISQFVGIDDKTLSGVMTELSNKIMLFATDNTLQKALSNKNTIIPQDIENGYDIYICIEESKLEQWRNLLTLIVNQFLKHFERRPDGESEPVLFLLDEFARLGKIETIINGLATLRSKKITIAILTQSLAQLDMIYGKEARQVIADNCQYKAILNATDADTQDYFSRLVGTYEKEKKSKTANFEQYSGLGKGKGISETTEEKRIIKPEDFATLKDLILLTPYGFYRVEKTSCYTNKYFKSKIS